MGSENLIQWALVATCLLADPSGARAAKGKKGVAPAPQVEAPAPPPSAPLEPIIAPVPPGLTLNECLLLAMERHPSIAAATARAQAFRAETLGPWTPYVPMLVLSAGVDHRVDPLAGPFYSYLYPDATINSQVFRAGLGVRGGLPIGTEYELTVDQSLGYYSSILESLNPRIEPGLRLSISQNLLRGFWIGTNLAPLDVADARAEEADAELIQRRDTILADVAGAWLLAAEAAEVLTLRRRSLDLARKFEVLTRQLIEGGEQSQLDLALALQTVAQREVDVARAQSAFDDAALALANAGWLEPAQVGVPTLAGGPPQAEVPTLEAVVARVRDYSPQLAQVRARSRRAEAARVVAEDRGLPDIRVGLVGQVRGLGGESRCLNGYLADGISPCALPPGYAGGYDAALLNLAGGKFYSVGVNITGTIPTWPGPQSAEGNAARLDAQAAQHELAARDHDIAWAARRAVDDVRNGEDLAGATKNAVSLAEKSLQAEETKLRAGRSTGLDLVRAQEILISTELQDVEGRARVARARLQMMAVMGRLAPEPAVVTR